jgi:hypothetical protein
VIQNTTVWTCGFAVLTLRPLTTEKASALCTTEMADGNDDRGNRYDRDGSEDLQASLRELAIVDIAASTLTQVLTRVATLAVRAVPGADGAAVMLGKADDQDDKQARSASARFVREIEAIQNTTLHVQFADLVVRHRCAQGHRPVLEGPGQARRRPGLTHQTGRCGHRLNRTGLVGVSIVWKRGWTHAEGHHPGEADDASVQP